MAWIPPRTFEHAHSIMNELIEQDDMQQDTVQTGSMFDILEPIRGKEGNRNILQQLLFSSWMSPMADILFPQEQRKEDAEPFLDFTGREGLSDEDIKQSWENLSVYGQNPKWKGREGSKIIHLPTPTDKSGSHAELPIDNYLEFLKLVDWHGLPDEKGRFHETKSITRY